jgi:hypothetical protein
MIQFSSAVQALMQEPVIETFTMIRMGDYRSTDYFRNITLSNGEVFLSDGRIINVDPPTMTTSVDRAQYNIVLADPSFEFAAIVDNYVGLPVTIRIGFINDGLPLTTEADTIIAYKGYVDNAAYLVETAELGEVAFKVTCSSPMMNLDKIKTFYTSKEALLDIDPKDTSFEQVYEGSGQISLKWGRV